ncbi:MAG: glycosyltransferase family 39 protein [Anaerolineae bacterium]|nr:glycosyltransferase family 39 protein [Phycisphaerae bacterium]
MRFHAIVWISSLVLMLWTIAFAPVQRTQEARVLESAREMTDSASAGDGWRGWMIPRANGIVRLQKPPLAYWMSAGSFKMFGVTDWAGRLPFALCGWLTILLTYHMALREFASIRAAVCSAGLLAGSFLFHRHARMAETDIVLTLMLTIAIHSIWRGFDPGARRRILWFQLSGIAIGLACIAKGPPAMFPILFLTAMTLITRRWRVALQWFISGAPLIAAIIGAPWWIYARSLPQGSAVARELNVLLDEPNHPGWFFVYFPYLLKAMLPWSPIAFVALIDASLNWRRDPQIHVRLTPPLAWCGSILVPLFFLGNKQEHYLLPMLPPLALIAGWWIDRATRVEQTHPARAIGRLIVIITSVVLAICALALPLAAQRLRGDIITTDLVIAIVLLLAATIVVLLTKRNLAAGLTAFSIAGAICLSAIIGFWWPTTETQSPRTVAAQIRAIGPGPYCFFGENFSLPLVYNLRSIVPQARNARELTQLMSDHPNLLIIAQTKSKVAPPPVPIGCETVGEIFMKDQKFEIYRSIQ